MRKLFGANKKKKPSSSLKASNLKIPIPMINGVEYADLTESQISTLIGGGNKDYHRKKLNSSLSSQRTNNTIQTEKTPSNIPVQKQQQQPVTPSRSISSPPVLVMPKPMHSIPPTRYLLGNHDFEKTQVESSNSSSSSSEEEEEEEEEQQIMSSPLPLTIVKTDEESKNYQSSTYVTRTSDDSIRQYISASESPFLTASSIVSSMNQTNLDHALSPSFSSPTKHMSVSDDVKYNGPKIAASSSVPPPFAPSFSGTIAAVTDLQDTKPASSNSNEAVIQEFPLPPSNMYTTDDSNRNLAPINEYDNIVSTTPIPIPTKKRVSRPPTSSSGSSATIGHDVTHSQSRFVNNNSDKPPGTLLQPISSEPSAFIQNNNNSKMDSLTEMLQNEIKKMALNEDLMELKRTVDRMQQQRVSDLEDHLTRVAEQKLREKEILEQIKLTKQRLDMAIAEKMFINNPENGSNQDLSHQSTTNQTPVMKPSNSTNTARINKLKSNTSSVEGITANSNNGRQEQQQQQQQQQQSANRQRNRRSFPSAHQRLPAQNEYFPDIGNPNFDFNDYPNQYGYPQDYNPEFDMMRMMNGKQNQFMDPFGMDSPRSRYARRKSSLQRRPRSKSMESQWQEQQEQENIYIHQQHSHPDLYQDGDFYYPTPRTRSRKSSLHSAKSSSSDSDNNNGNKRSDLQDNFEQPSTTTANEGISTQEKKSAPGRHPEMVSDEDRHHASRHRNGSGRFRRGHVPHPGNIANMPPNMFGYPNGLPPLPYPMDRERMKMRPPPPPPPHPYGYNNMPPPPGNEYFSYMPPSQRISPRMMAALAADEQNQQQQQQQQQQPYGGYQWGPHQGMYGIPPPPPPDNSNPAANLPCEQQPDQPAFGNRRFPPPPLSAAGGQQSAPLQQTPQPPPPPHQGYMSMYGERIYM